jgi:3-deoxy-D-manno-octulosonic-acid transferase
VAPPSPIPPSRKPRRTPASSFFTAVFFATYEALLVIVHGLLGVVTALGGSKKLRRFHQLRGQDQWLQSLRTLESVLGVFPERPRVLWIHVASVGEMEQAIPVARALHERHGTRFLVTYFSPSTEAYLGNFPACIASLPLPLDIRSRHLAFLRLLRERADCRHLVFVRYDLWPGLLRAAREEGLRIALLAATARKTRGGLAGWSSRIIEKKIYGSLDHIFTVNPEDEEKFARVAPRARIWHAGDPKWARARERAEALKAKGLSGNLKPLAALCRAFQEREGRVFVFGSPHAEEHDVALRLAHTKGALVIYVPHDPTKEHVETILAECQEQGVEAKTLSSLGPVETQAPAQDEGNAPVGSGDSQPHTPPPLFTPHPFHEHSPSTAPVQGSVRDSYAPKTCKLLVVDRTGVLAEIYSLADAAVVGGGFDGQIHNTLEPAAHPVPVLCGSRLTRSPEAERLVEAGAARAFTTPEHLFQFLEACVRVGDGVGPETAWKPVDAGAQLMELRLRALELFKRIPSTSEVVSKAFFETC